MRETLLYIWQLRQGTVVRCAGHNPLAIWMIWLIWSLVLLLGLTGWMSRLDAFWGDDTVHLAHALLADFLLACVGLHLVAVSVMSFLLKENLLLSMLFRRRVRK
ncbi:MAG: cytochrome b/b6 domain-containing protein [Proteobacteria bacterium]|nr:cytochrome b/b6 domain-containing protein [Pseudomonadota bacterium]